MTDYIQFKTEDGAIILVEAAAEADANLDLELIRSTVPRRG